MGGLKENLNKKKKKKIKKDNKIDTETCQKDVMPKKEVGNKKNEPTRKNKRKREKGNGADSSKAIQMSKDEQLIKVEEQNKRNKTKKKKRKSVDNALVGKFDQLGSEGRDGLNEQNGESKKSKKKKMKHHTTKVGKDMLQKGVTPMESENLPEKREEVDQEDSYYISSDDEDCSKGMKKWLTEYHQSRPGLTVLQQRIDEFITAHEEKLEQERKEREALAAEGGWTVVKHHKGRKKTTDSESGMTVGSVAQVVVENNLAKKKNSKVGLDFYRFQKERIREMKF